MTTILVVEDDRIIADTLAISLRARDYTVRQARTAGEAIACFAAAPGAEPAGSIDCVLLDLGLPDLDGQTVIDAIRGHSEIPIIVVSARSGPEDKIDALDRGADDYIIKPFNLRELLARLRATLRRFRPERTAPTAVTTADGRLAIDLMAATVTLDGHRIHLTPQQWKIVEALARGADRLVGQRELLHTAWGPGYDAETNYLRVYMSQIRAKLEPDPSHPRYFHTEPGMGYRFTP